MTKQMKAAGSAIALAAVLLSNTAFGATAIGHVSVTILPTPAGVMETSPIELAALSVIKPGGRAHSTGRGVVTVTGPPNEAITISVKLRRRHHRPRTGHVDWIIYPQCGQIPSFE